MSRTKQVHPWTQLKSQCREILRKLPRPRKVRDVWRLLESARQREALESIGCDGEPLPAELQPRVSGDRTDGRRIEAVITKQAGEWIFHSPANV